MPYSALPAKAAAETLDLSNYDNIRDNFAAGVPDIFTTKGDLAAATAADAASRVAVGTAPALLVPDTGQSTGLVWHTLGKNNVATEETTSSSSYGDLSTAGPSVTATVGASGIALVLFSAKVQISGGGKAYFGVKVDSTDPTDAEAATRESLVYATTITGFAWITGLSAASHTFKLVYRSTSGDAYFSDRQLVVIPF
jgi:hypothetical protein